MKLTGIIKNKIDEEEPMEEKKNIIAGESIELSDEDLEGIAGGLGKKTTETGFKCPQCGGFVPVSMYQIMASSSVFCANCGLRMDIAKEQSESLLSHLQKLGL